MEIGDRVWVERKVEKVFGDGYIRVNIVGEDHEIDAIPESPALPAIARWLVEFPGDFDVIESALYIAAEEVPRGHDWELVRKRVAALSAGPEGEVA